MNVSDFNTGMIYLNVMEIGRYTYLRIKYTVKLFGSDYQQTVGRGRRGVRRKRTISSCDILFQITGDDP